MGDATDVADRVMQLEIQVAELHKAIEVLLHNPNWREVIFPYRHRKSTNAPGRSRTEGKPKPIALWTNHLSTAQQSPRKTMMRGSQDLPPELQAQAREQRLVLLKPSRSAYCHQP